MNMFRISRKNLREEIVKTTPENVKEANEGLFRVKTQKEMKLTFFEYLKYHPVDYEVS